MIQFLLTYGVLPFSLFMAAFMMRACIGQKTDLLSYLESLTQSPTDISFAAIAIFITVSTANKHAIQNIPSLIILFFTALLLVTVLQKASRNQLDKSNILKYSIVMAFNFGLSLTMLWIAYAILDQYSNAA